MCGILHVMPLQQDGDVVHAIGFSASRVVEHPDDITAVLATVQAGKFVTGGARGGDAIIGLWLYEHRPDAKHVVVLPSNKSQIDFWWKDKDGILVVKMPEMSDFRSRNRHIVELSDELYAFPGYPEDHPKSTRSGTWQTVRMARRVGIPAKEFILSW